VMAECFDLFPKDSFATRSEVEHREATELFKAAVMAARTGNDDSIKQVFGLNLSIIIFFSLISF